MLHLHDTRRYEMPLESFMEEIPFKHSIVRKGLPILIPPYAYRTLQLVSYILGLQTHGQPKQAELLFHRVQPLLRLKGFFSLSDGGFVSMKSLKLLYWLGASPPGAF